MIPVQGFEVNSGGRWYPIQWILPIATREGTAFFYVYFDAERGSFDASQGKVRRTE